MHGGKRGQVPLMQACLLLAVLVMLQELLLASLSGAGVWSGLAQ